MLSMKRCYAKAFCAHMCDPQGNFSKGMISNGKVFSDGNAARRKATDGHTSARYDPQGNTAEGQQPQGQRACGKSAERKSTKCQKSK